MYENPNIYSKYSLNDALLSEFLEVVVDLKVDTDGRTKSHAESSWKSFLHALSFKSHKLKEEKNVFCNF